MRADPRPDPVLAAVTSPDDGVRSVEPLPFTYQVTKYDPADRDADGAYTGTEDSMSDHGPVEAAYLDAFTAFAEDAGIDHVELREPEIGGFINFGLEPHIDGHGLRGLFPDDLSGYHDGASVSLDTARELVRAMLRDNGAWCRLEVDGRFTAHVGYDQYLYLGTSVLPDRAVALAEASGLFAERIERSPSAWESDDPPARPADSSFWDEVAALVTVGGSLLLCERFVGNASRWQRLTPERIDQVRTGLVPRSCVEVWPDLSTDLRRVRRQLRRALRQGPTTLVTVDDRGVLTHRLFFRRREAAAAMAGVSAALVVSGTDDGDSPLVTAVLPDADGVLRARWMPWYEPGPAPLDR